MFDADIKGAFDHISHEALLRKLHTYPQLHRLIKGWLQAGVMEGVDFSPTGSGTPQGGVISPLLMNVALHGMEQAMAEAKYQHGKPTMVRYADDFLLFHPDKEIHSGSRPSLPPVKRPGTPHPGHQAAPEKAPTLAEKYVY